MINRHITLIKQPISFFTEHKNSSYNLLIKDRPSLTDPFLYLMIFLSKWFWSELAVDLLVEPPHRKDPALRCPALRFITGSGGHVDLLAL